MNRTQRAMFTKELQRASAALNNAFQIANQSTDGFDVRFRKQVKEQQRTLGEMIVAFNGGPTVAIQEMVQ